MKLRFKMLLPFILLFSIVLTGSSLYVIPKYEKQVTQEAITQESTYLKLLSITLQPALLLNDMDALTDFSEEILSEHSNWYSLSVRASDEPLNLSLAQRNNDDNVKLNTITSDIMLSGGRRGSLELVMNVSQGVTSQLDHIRHFRRAALGILLFSILTVSLFLDRLILRPLIKLVNFAGQISKGDYEQKQIKIGTDEVGQLGASLEVMRQKIMERDQAMRRVSEVQDVVRLIQSKLTLDQDIQQVYGSLQQRILTLTESETGLICEIVEDDNRVTCLNPLSLNHTLGLPSSNRPAKICPEYSLLSEVVSRGCMVIHSNKQSPKEELGFPVPAGVTVEHFMGLPLYNSYRLVGVLCLVNRKQGFNKRLAKEIETLLQPLAGLITAYQERTTLTESEARLRLLVDNAVEGIVTTNDKGNIITFNPAAERIFGYSKSQVMGRSIGILVPREQIQEYMLQTNKMLSISNLSGLQSNKELEADGLHRNGKLIPLELSITQVKTQQGIQFTGIIRDISDRKQQEAELSKAYADLQKAHELMEEQNRRDSLTGLANRRFLDQILAREWARTERKGTNELSIILCDIDYFKRYNDTYGHLEGDECLRKVSKVLSDSFTRKVDLVARYGGEEFMIVLPDTSAIAAVAMAEAMRKNILALNVEHKSSPVASNITISVGVFTGGPAVSRNLNNAIQRADQALYKAKAAGRNQVVHDCKPACTCPPVSDQTL